MPSSDQSSGAGSSNFKVAEKNDSVVPELVKNLEQMKDLLFQIRPDNNNSNRGNNNGNSGNNGSSHSSQDDNRSVDNQVEKLREDLSYIGQLRTHYSTLHQKSFKNFNGFEGRANGFLKGAIDLLRTGGPNQSLPYAKLYALKLELDKIMVEMKLQILSAHKLLSDAHRIPWGGTFEVDKLHVDNGFGNSSALGDFRSVYESLEFRTKSCLLCFALIPENEIVQKRFMTYWWVGEEFVQVEKADDGTSIELSVEQVADRIFKEMEQKGCIEPVNNKLRFVVDSYKMNPLIRLAVIVLAKEANFFDFDDEGNPSAEWKSSNRACLGDGFIYKELFKSKSESKSKRGTGSDASGLEAEELKVIFNVNEPYPDVFELGWFSKLKNVKVLYLGRWQTSSKHHIEVESFEFLKGLKSLKRLRFFSLQGVTRISKLPDSVCDLLNLRILDLRACHSLEVLPNGIGSLENLTHLDISDCYLLENMPKGIGSLSKLQVLKGFVISDNSRSKSCTLDALSKLTNLGKLSIYTNKEAFPEDADVTTLLKFVALRKLTITWGAGAFTTKEDSQVKQDDGAASAICIKCFPKAFPKLSTLKNATSAICIKCFPKPFPKLSSFKNAAEPGPKETPEQMEASTTLEKLDLKCYPRMEAPCWLLPGKFPKLEKLYIRGGNLENLEKNEKWKVEILHLKFLSNLKMDWKELRASFPELRYLEKYKCPKLTFFPCNENEIQLKDRTSGNENSCEA